MRYCIRAGQILLSGLVTVFLLVILVACSASREFISDSHNHYGKSGAPEANQIDDTQTVVFTHFKNPKSTKQPLEIYLVVIDPETGFESEALVNVIESGETKTIPSFPGFLYRFRERDIHQQTEEVELETQQLTAPVFATYYVDNYAHQAIDLLSLRRKWMKRSEPRLPILFEELFVVPDGEWHNQGSDFFTDLSLSSDDLGTVYIELPNGNTWTFFDVLDEPNTYAFAETTLETGQLQYLAAGDEAALYFPSEDEAILKTDKHTISLARSREGAVESMIERFNEFDLEGIWVDKAGYGQEEFTLYYSNPEKRTAGVTMKLSEGTQWTFLPKDISSGTYYFSKAYDTLGYPIFTSQNQLTTLQFEQNADDAEATLYVGGSNGKKQELKLIRDTRNDIANVLANSFIVDPDWRAWVERDQNEYRKIWRDSDSAEMGIIDGFSGELLASQRPSYRGYNVAYMNMDKLADFPGIPNDNFIFRVPADNSREWSIHGTGYRIPWSLHYRQQVVGLTKSVTEFFTSEERRQESMSIGATYTPYSGGFNKASESLESTNEMCLRSSKYAAEYWLILNKSHIQLSESFRRFVEENLLVGNEPTKDSKMYVKLFESFGTHYPIATLFGGRAFQEKKVSTNQVASTLSSGWNAGYENTNTLSASAKGVGISKTFTQQVGIQSSQSDTNQSGSTDESYRFYYSGGSGTSFEMWDIGENKKLVPIKTYLKPIHELILPRLFSSDDLAIYERLRTAIASEWSRYLDQKKAGTSKPIDRTPRIFSLRIKEIRSINAQDESLGPPIEENQYFGKISFKLEFSGNKGSATVVGPDKPWNVLPFDREWNNAQALEKNDLLTLDPLARLKVIVTPELEFVDKQWQASWPLSSVKLKIVSELEEFDTVVHAPNEDLGRTMEVTLVNNMGEDRFSEGSTHDGSFILEQAGSDGKYGGKLKVTYELKEFDYSLESTPAELPKLKEFE